MTGEMQKSSNGPSLDKVTPEMLVNSILGPLDMNDAPESIKPEMNRIVGRLQEDLTDYFNILKTAKEQTAS